jgi:hypothetical protein
MYQLHTIECDSPSEDLGTVRTLREARRRAKNHLRALPEYDGERLYVYDHPDRGTEVWEWDEYGTAVEIAGT